jgi:hypothetical protein
VRACSKGGIRELLFDSGQMALLQRIVDLALAEIGISAESEKTRIAERVIAAAAGGEWDFDVLMTAARAIFPTLLRDRPERETPPAVKPTRLDGLSWALASDRAASDTCYFKNAVKIAAMPKRQRAIFNWITMTVTFDLPRMWEILREMKTPGS